MGLSQVVDLDCKPLRGLRKSTLERAVESFASGHQHREGGGSKQGRLGFSSPKPPHCSPKMLEKHWTNMFEKNCASGLLNIEETCMHGTAFSELMLLQLGDIRCNRRNDTFRED